MTLQSGGLAKRILPNEPNTNGYLDYLKAADGISVPEFSMYRVCDSSNPGSDAKAFATPLARKKSEVEKFGIWLKLMAQGNTKVSTRGTRYLGLEDSRFMDLTQLACDSAYIAYSRGDWLKGTNQMLELMTFCNNVHKQNLRALQAGNNLFSTALTAFVAQRDRWSVEDCERIVKRTSAFLNEKSPILNALEADYAAAPTKCDQILAGTSEGYSNSPEGLNLARKIGALSASDLQILKITVGDHVKATFEPLMKRFRQEEAAWNSDVIRSSDPIQSTSSAGLSPLAESILKMVVPTQAELDSGIKSRRQIRLLNLYANVQGFRWHRGHLPSLLTEVAARSELIDPRTKKLFRLDQKTGSAYRIVVTDSENEDPLAPYSPSVGGG